MNMREDTYSLEPPRATEEVRYRSHSHMEVNHDPQRSEASRAQRQRPFPPAPVSEYLGVLSSQGKMQKLWWVSVAALFSAILVCKK